MKLRVLATVLALCAALFMLGACGGNDSPGEPGIPTLPDALTIPEEGESVHTPWKEGDANPTITITMDDGGVITAVLYPDKAPNTVNNFISLANSGYFEGKIFHRVIPGFMIQGGSPNGDGMSIGFPYSIRGEFRSNGFVGNNIKHVRGVLSMARTGVPDSAGCQFFIMHDASSSLDGDYAAFGMVMTGMDVVDRIVNLPRNASDKPDNPPAIKSVVADTHGIDYPEPVTLPAQ